MLWRRVQRRNSLLFNGSRPNARSSNETTSKPPKTVSEYVAELKQCTKLKDLERGQSLHLHILAAGFHHDRYVSSSLIAMYSRCNSMDSALEVFQNIAHRDVAVWNSLIRGYVDNGQSSVAMEFFQSMDCEPSSVTFIAVLKACLGLAAAGNQRTLGRVIAIHEVIQARGLAMNTVLASTLVDVYSKLGYITRAREVFEILKLRNAVTWTSLIMGYVDQGRSTEALELFARMDCEPDHCTFMAALKACACLAVEKESERLASLNKAAAIHERVRSSGLLSSHVSLACSLMDVYKKCGDMRRCREVFDAIAEKNSVTWNCVLVGHVDNAEYSKALEMYYSMDCEPDCLTYAAVLKAAAQLGEFPVAEGIRVRACRLGLDQEKVVTTALVGFYGKSGRMPVAEELFNSLHSPDVLSWTSLIAGYSSLGNSHEVFRLESAMEEAGLRMDAVTFLCILMACSHAGMVEEGKRYFRGMSRHGLTPNVEHYNCMVDMLGRANRLDEALALARSMGSKADTVTWRTLLAACRKWENVKVAELALELVK